MFQRFPCRGTYPLVAFSLYLALPPSMAAWILARFKQHINPRLYEAYSNNSSWTMSTYFIPMVGLNVGNEAIIAIIDTDWRMKLLHILTNQRWGVTGNGLGHVRCKKICASSSSQDLWESHELIPWSAVCKWQAVTIADAPKMVGSSIATG